MEDKKLKKVFFLGVSNEERNNIAYSNFAFSLCYFCLTHLNESFDVSGFNRHDMMPTDNLRDSIFQNIAKFDMFIFLLDEMPLKYKDDSGLERIIPMYNPNVWFELGIAAPQLEKPIVLLSRKNSNPFYANPVQTHFIPISVEKHFFLENISLFDVQQVTDRHKVRWLNYWETEYSKEDNEDRCHEELVNFIDRLTEKIAVAHNPFRSAIITSDLLAVLEPGNGETVHRLLKDYANDTVARFYSGEKTAFQELTEAVEQATESLQTTRFANRSIVSGLEINSAHHMRFMQQLYEKSQVPSIVSKRIICNNNYTKWNDIYQMLLNGGKVKIYIRKYEYSTNFELVIVDRRITFIHFYQLSRGNINDDGTENVQDHQVINSTLKLEGHDVAEHMSEVFDRLYQREPGETSRTLLGTLTEDEEHQMGLSNQSEWENNGVLQITSNSLPASPTREMEVKKLLVDSFISWHPYMMNSKDVFNMGLGIGLIVFNSIYFSKYKEFIKKTSDYDRFLKGVRSARDKVKDEAKASPSHHRLLEQFTLFLEALR